MSEATNSTPWELVRAPQHLLDNLQSGHEEGLRTKAQWRDELGGDAGTVHVGGEAIEVSLEPFESDPDDTLLVIRRVIPAQPGSSTVSE